MGKEKIDFKYNETEHTITCIRSVHNRSYTGIAKCHPLDYEWESKRVGEHYAYMRSLVDEARHMRDLTTAELKSAKHILNIIYQNTDDPVAIRLIERQVKTLTRDRANTVQLIKDIKQELKTEMEQRDALHVKLTENRLDPHEVGDILKRILGRLEDANNELHELQAQSIVDSRSVSDT